MNEWVGKEILFPDNIPCYILGKDTLQDFCKELFRKEFKILLYIDSAGCSHCRLKLFEWKQLIREANSLFHGNVGFLFFFQPKNVKEVRSLFIQERFTYPVFMDTEGLINSLNHFPHKQEYQCFLLDSNNKVLSIGNPALNQRIWEIYLEKISNQKEISLNALESFTTFTVDKTIHDFGSIRKSDSNPAVFTITNTGNHPLVISRVSASCGCTNVEWNKQPVEPGKTASIRVEMRPEETGYFRKTVEVYCNTKESPVKLTITGTTI